MNRFWIPDTKLEAISWLVRHRGMSVTVLRKMKSKQVRAIYIKERIKGG